MQVSIYRSSVKDGLYVYVDAETSPDSLPIPVMKQLGRDPEKAMDLNLEKDSKLSNAEAAEVLEAIENQGFYVQMPHDIETLMAMVTGTTPVPKKQ